jgi:glycosyltransferase involved in cell wall biosynthesis
VARGSRPFGTRRRSATGSRVSEKVTSELSVLVSPQDDNPYQELLYGELRKAGVRVRYAEGPTQSHSANLLLSPAMLAVHRLRGFRILHLHWVFQFSLPWAGRNNWARRAVQWWFGLYLRVASALGYAIIWTAHDLLPHEPVFADDEQAHRDLLARAHLVIALSPVSADELLARGARVVKTIPFGTYSATEPREADRQQARSILGLSPDEYVVVHLGKILPYKGTDLLLTAVPQVPSDLKMRVLVVGRCVDNAYSQLLTRLAESSPDTVLLRLEHVDDEEMSRYLVASDVAVFPFRAVTNSSSIVNAQSFGLPVIIPDLVTLRDIPSTSALRYDGSVEGLALTLASFPRLAPAVRRELSAAARRFATSTDWQTVATMTLAAYHEVLLSR